MNEQKLTKALAVAAALLIVAMAVAAFMLGNNGESIYVVSFERDIVVENGIAESAVFAERIIIEDSAQYRMRLGWVSSPGLVTGARLIDGDGSVLFYSTGECLDAEFDTAYLKEGEYSLEFTMLTNAEDFTEYVLSNSDGKEPENAGEVSDYSGRLTDISEYEFVQNGMFKNAFNYELVESGAFGGGRAAGLMLGVIAGAALAVVLMLTRKDNGVRAKYDERQQVARGNGYRIGFWTGFAYFTVAALCGIVEINIPAEPSVIAFVGIVLSAFMFVVYCIMTDAYIALNENRRAVWIALVLIGAVNLAIGILNIIHGEAIENGVFTFRGLNLICGVFVAAIGVVLLIRQIMANRERFER